MIAYPDTSFLGAVYRTQDHSRIADAYRKQMPEPLYVTQLLQFEFLQSIRLQVWLHAQDKRKGYSQAQASQMVTDWSTDIASGVVELVSCDMELVLSMAQRLSDQHTSLSGNRTLDIIHIATAVHLRAAEFLTFDQRQRQLAHAAGLRTPV